MAHIARDQKKLLGRVRRIRGQVEAIDRLIEGGRECDEVLQQIAALRGAVNGLMAHVLEGHIREHVIDSAREPTKGEARALDELAQIMKSYLK